MSGKMTLVLGASPKADRYSHRAVLHLRAHGHPLLAVGLRESMIDDIPVVTSIPDGSVFDTVTLYLNANNQAPWQERLLALKPKRIIFNPGAENPAFARAAEAKGIEALEACTLVMLGTGQY